VGTVGLQSAGVAKAAGSQAAAIVRA
jgi:hypothetical protein